MKLNSILAGAALAALIGSFALAGCSGGDSGAATNSTTKGTEGASAAMSLTGAGSTFVNPAMSQWTYAYHQQFPSITINYQSVGSGAGIAQYKNGTVDFACSDAPLSDKDEATMPAPTLNLPVVLGATTIAFNIDGVTDLNLSPDVIAGIFLGQIKTWDDPKIKADNPTAKLPSIPIAVCHRSDGSGTTYIFTDYLSTVSPAWKAGPGKGKDINWPVGVGGKGNEGVAGLIQKTPGAIGYIELAYAIQTKMTYAALKNAAGKLVKPNPDSTAAAASGYHDALQKDIRSSIVNSPAPEAYPIAGFTYALVSTKPADTGKSKAIQDFLKWAMADGQKMAADLQYAPLPKDVVDLNLKAMEGIQAGAK